jgi:hypothetical protein
MAHYANRRREMPVQSQRGLLINNIPHGDRILCGTNPCWLYARKVSKLKIEVDEKKANETISWVEPPEYRLKDGTKHAIELAVEGEVKQIERSFFTPLSKDVWDR